MLIHIQLFVTPWTQGSSIHGVFQARIHGVGCPFYAPRDLPDPGIEPKSLVSLALAGRFFTTETTWEACDHNTLSKSLAINVPPNF